MTLLMVSYLAGVLTILSPCILPVLPFVFARSEQSFAKGAAPLLVGMALTFSLLSTIAVVGGAWISEVSGVGRSLALVLLGLFGLSMIFPRPLESLLSPLARLGSKIGAHAAKESSGTSFLVGVGTGLLWAPCAGPVLGLILTGAASRSATAQSLGLLLAYSFGAATSLAIALFAGKRTLTVMRKYLGFDRAVKVALGVLVLLGVSAIALDLDRTVLTRLSKAETSSFEKRLLKAAEVEPEEPQPQSMMMMGAPSSQPENVEGLMPELNGVTSWINSTPLTKESLLGKVVLIDFWTYSCINCLRTLPYVKAWADKYKANDFVVIGIHTPEFAFERNPRNVQNAVKDLGITYPVAMDNDYRVWNAFGNHYWPAHYFIDRRGRIRHHHFGEGEYEQSEKVIRDLLSEHGESIETRDVTVKASGAQAAASPSRRTSPETYLGYMRAENFTATPALQPDRSIAYESSPDLAINQWSLQGKWSVQAEKAVLKEKSGKIRFRFQARDLHLVLGGPSKVKFQIRIDGQAPGARHGEDTDEDGRGEITADRLYQLIRLKGGTTLEDHLFEIEFFDPGAEAFAFTFG